MGRSFMEVARATTEIVRVLARVRKIEVARLQLGPVPAVLLARRMGEKRPVRAGAQRAGLQRAIRWVDRITSGGPNCLRRSLLELSLDGGAAEELLSMGFRVGGVPKSGHAWLASESQAVSYDAVVRV
jgi:hypothetical protein